MLKFTDRGRGIERPWRRAIFGIVAALICCPRFLAQSEAGVGVEQIRQLVSEQRWQEIVTRLAAPHSPSADLDFYYGTALARLARWKEAEQVFKAGERLAPSDPRFPEELAGVAFKQRHYPQATRHLRRAIRLAPNNSYANDFLATVYFLEGNLEAAVKYWNRVGKPSILESHAEPEPRVDPGLLDQAFAFSPASTMRVSELLATDTRIRGLGIFPSYRFDLRAGDNDRFDFVFRNQERNGFGRTKWESLFLLLRGLPFLSVSPEFYNFRHEAINFISAVRLDTQKRRVLARVSSPLERSAKYRYEVAADLRNENWDLTSSLTLPIQMQRSLNMRREAVSFKLASFASGRWQWSAGAEISHRDFRSVVLGTASIPQLLAKGYQLQQSAGLKAALWRLPERRFNLTGDVSSQVARLWSSPEESFAKLQAGAAWHWFPREEGDDYETQQQVRVGKTFGSVPFDELFMLGLERDSDLPMRGHIATREGRKGRGPLGRNYFLSNLEADKNVFGNGLLTAKVGPFLDTGKVSDPSAALGSHEWLWDTGVQAKLRAFGIGIVFSYGKDLRSGNNAFYVRMLRADGE